MLNGFQSWAKPLFIPKPVQTQVQLEHECVSLKPKCMRATIHNNQWESDTSAIRAIHIKNLNYPFLKLLWDKTVTSLRWKIFFLFWICDLWCGLVKVLRTIHKWIALMGKMAENITLIQVDVNVLPTAIIMTLTEIISESWCWKMDCWLCCQNTEVEAHLSFLREKSGTFCYLYEFLVVFKDAGYKNYS